MMDMPAYGRVHMLDGTTCQGKLTEFANGTVRVETEYRNSDRIMTTICYPVGISRIVFCEQAHALMFLG